MAALYFFIVSVLGIVFFLGQAIFNKELNHKDRVVALVLVGILLLIASYTGFDVFASP